MRLPKFQSQQVRDPRNQEKKNETTTEQKAALTQVHLVERFSKKLYLLAFKIHLWIVEYFRKLSNRLLLWYPPAKGPAYLLVKWSQIIRTFSLAFCSDIESFTLCIKPPRTAKINLANSRTSWSLRVRTHETTPRSTALWLGRKTQKFSGTNQKAERPRRFGTGLVKH